MATQRNALITIITGQGGRAILTFLRNWLLVRGLSPAEYGQAATYSVIFSLVEMITQFSIDRYLIISDEEEVQAALPNGHALQFFRGVVVSLFLFACAPLIAAWFRYEDYSLAYGCMGLIFLLRSGVHFGIAIQQRKMNFIPTHGSYVLSEVFAICAILVGLWLHPSHYILLIGLGVQSLTLLVASHCFSKEKYAFQFDKELWRKIWNFSWPLLLNALMMYIGLHSDKFVIGRYYDKILFGEYFIVSSLFMIYTMQLRNINDQFSLPIFSKAKNDPGHLAQLFTKNFLRVASLAFLGALVLSFFGHPLFSFVYQRAFDFSYGLFLPFSLWSFLRIIRSCTGAVALSLSQPHYILQANICRNCAMTLVILMILKNISLEWVVFALCASECLAFSFTYVRLIKKCPLPRWILLIPPLICALFVAWHCV
ncbi:MAG: oligosaccharide flippase family protein [Planctomycetes bacterium]|nr:oligosaccharide flippase family protein [Planctomycetota bacterium]